ncbi:MAG: SRPBCC family protein [Gemmatimonadota bacterium]|nr:SRPBCC family protein [Gemmatimonadota bacterium]
MTGSPFSLGTKILGGAATLLIGLLVLGFLLPSDWEAGASKLVADASPRDVYSLLDTPEGWRSWTAWPDSGLERSGPERGPGASMSWDDPDLGEGLFRIVEVTPPERVTYEVEVGRTMRTTGTLSLAPDGEGVRISWRETGTLGPNPLMGYWALFMDRAQTAELERSLDRLDDVVSGSGRSR